MYQNFYVMLCAFENHSESLHAINFNYLWFFMKKNLYKRVPNQCNQGRNNCKLLRVYKNHPNRYQQVMLGEIKHLDFAIAIFKATWN